MTETASGLSLTECVGDRRKLAMSIETSLAPASPVPGPGPPVTSESLIISDSEGPPRRPGRAPGPLATHWQHRDWPHCQAARLSDGALRGRGWDPPAAAGGPATVRPSDCRPMVVLQRCPAGGPRPSLSLTVALGPAALAAAGPHWPGRQCPGPGPAPAAGIRSESVTRRVVTPDRPAARLGGP